MLALLLALTASLRYLQLALGRGSAVRPERSGEERTYRRNGSRIDRYETDQTALAIAVLLALSASLMWAGWLLASLTSAAPPAGWPLGIAVALIFATAAAAVDATLRQRSERHRTEAPPRSVRMIAVFIATILAPLAFPITRLTSSRRRAQTYVSADDMAEEEIETGVLEENEEQLGDYIAEFRETEVREVMTSRMDIVAIPYSASLAEAVDIIERSGHSRLPVFRDHLDHIEGILYVKDLLPLLADGVGDSHPDWGALVRPTVLVPMDQAIEDLLRAFKSKRTHIAIVIDEYGGTEGLITLEDILEELVGDIRDEFDQDEPEMYERLEELTFRFDARIDLDELQVILESFTGIEVPAEFDTDEFEFETLGGLIQHLTESVPTAGIEVEMGRIHMTVEDVEQHRIGHVIVTIHPERLDGAEPGVNGSVD